MKIIKLKNGPFNNAAETIEKLTKSGWKCEIVRDDEIHSHGTQSCNFQHTYIWTVLCQLSPVSVSNDSNTVKTSTQ